MREKLNKTQKKTVQEIDEIIELIGLDHRNILNYDKEARTPVLHNMKDQIMRSAVVMDYVLIDEFLSQVLVEYYFGRAESSIDLWKTKKFKLFNYCILEKLYLLNKLDHVKEIIEIPSSIETKIRKLNDLRNSLAHSFFPENRKVKICYDGKSVYALQGFKEYHKDVEKITTYFMNKLWKVKI